MSLRSGTARGTGRASFLLRLFVSRSDTGAGDFRRWGSGRESMRTCSKAVVVPDCTDVGGDERGPRGRVSPVPGSTPRGRVEPPPAHTYGWAYKHGHRIEYQDGDWVYADTGENCAPDRPCVQCGQLPTPEGYDACLGEIPGAVSACCGHGVQDGYVIWPEKPSPGCTYGRRA